MLSKTKSMAVFGVDAYVVDVEVDISNGLPSFDIVGLGDTEVKESRDRVRSAIRNSGYKFQTQKITVNLAPANTKKEGTAFDLPLAIGILKATEQIKKEDLSDTVFIGELSLDGSIRPVNGVLPMAIGAKKFGFSRMVVPYDNAYEAAVVEGLDIYSIKNLKEAVDFLNEEVTVMPFVLNYKSEFSEEDYEIDFSEVKGQENVKRVLEIAAAGAHNVIMIGPPGSGKTMLARRFPTILPNMSFEEALDVTKIYSIAGLLPKGTSLIRKRTFRSPHHTVSTAALVGGGKYPKPGEVSLAHYGVLFLDELPEFRKDALEVLRQPLEDEFVTISRVNGSFTYPSKFQLIAAMNPCPCGYFGDETHVCRCNINEIRRYQNKISGPLLDRIDLYVEVRPLRNDRYLEDSIYSESSAKIRERVNKARKIQLERYSGTKIFFNSQLSNNLIKKYCKLDTYSKDLLKSAFEKFHLSVRSYNKILKIARTIADLEGKENISYEHIAEAIQYRTQESTYWNK